MQSFPAPLFRRRAFGLGTPSSSSPPPCPPAKRSPNSTTITTAINTNGVNGSNPSKSTNAAVIGDVLSLPQPGIDFHGIPNPPPGTPLRLSDLRERLIRQEETIIFAIIERAQFQMNSVIYVPNAFDLPDYPHLTFSQYMLYELEKVHATVGRYSSPDEHSFYSRDLLPPSVLQPLEFPPTLVPNSVNVNSTIERVYLESILPVICEPGDDQNYGSSATCDASCLQALSKRIHYGKFIAEAKCQEDDQTYRQLAFKRDRTSILELLTNSPVERDLLKRVENKARNYGSDITNEGARDVYKVEPALMADVYRDFIIPLTKEVEVDYVIERYTRQ